MSKKNKDKYYKIYLKRGIIVSILFFLISTAILMLTFLDCKNQIKFKETAVKTVGKIVDVKYKNPLKATYRDIDVDEVEYIVVDYNVNNIKYTANIRHINSRMFIGKNITIYYNSENPTDVQLIDLLDNITLIALSGIFSVVGIIILIISTSKIIRYIETLNGVEIKADIIRVIEKNNFGWKRYIIECKGNDESGEERIYKTRPFNESYIEKEIEKMKSKTVIVRYKKCCPLKYIVLTEKLEKILSR